MFLEVKDIKLSFTNAHKETFNLLNGVNLSVDKGKITALVGGNGAGKTTLFNIISGFEKGYTGDVIFEGNNLNRIPPHRISLMGIGRLLQPAHSKLNGSIRLWTCWSSSSVQTTSTSKC